MDWFNVDKQGLAKLIEKKGKGFALLELIQNAWDTDTKEVIIDLAKLSGRPLATISVQDDDPEGFKNLSHAFTLFAESEKKGDATKRGRFNLGEKLVLAACDEATITSTTGGVRFDKDGRHTIRVKRPAGSRFQGTLRMNYEEYDEAVKLIWTLIPPPGVRTVFNGQEIPQRKAKAFFTEVLPTEIADAEGYLRKSTRRAEIRVYEPLTGEVPMLYEMGIPVVETNDKWHIDIGQKIPLSMDRDNVTPAYLRTVRTVVVNQLFQQVAGEEASAGWVREAASDKNITPEAMEHIMTQRFGEKRVAYDMSDPEANHIAVSKGYQVIHGASLSKEEWSNVKANGLALPAGQVTPSDKILGGGDDKTIAPEKYSSGMKEVADYSERIARAIGIPITVKIINDPFASFAACYGGGQLTYNAGRLGYQWFDRGINEAVNELFIHELAHHYSSNHLSEEYYDGICRIGAKMVALALQDQAIFERQLVRR